MSVTEERYNYSYICIYSKASKESWSSGGDLGFEGWQGAACKFVNGEE